MQTPAAKAASPDYILGISLRVALRQWLGRYRWLVAATLVFMPLAGWACWSIWVDPYARQATVADSLRRAGAKVRCEPAGAGWLRGLLGKDSLVRVVHVDLGKVLFQPEMAAALAKCSDLHTLVVGGPNFGNGDLRSLGPLTGLKVLVLDSTCNDPAALGALSRRLPATTIHRSQRRAIEAVRSAGGEVKTEATGSAELRRFFGDEHCRQAIWVLLDHTAISDQDLAHVAALSSVRYLKLSGTRITDRGLARLRTLTNLAELDLSDTQISDAGLGYLRSLGHLQSLYVANTAVTMRGVRPLQRAIPQLRVIPLPEWTDETAYTAAGRR